MRNILITISMITILALAGGGGSSSGGGGGGGGGGGFSSGSGSSSEHEDPCADLSGQEKKDCQDKQTRIAIIAISAAAVFCVFVIVVVVLDSHKKNQKNKNAASNVPPEIVEKTSEIFRRYQADWSKNDAQAMRTYMTPEYHHRAELMIRALEEQGRRNEVRDPDPGCLIQTSDMADSLDIKFNNASADDVLIDDRTNQILKQDKVIFSETWTFNKGKNGELKLASTKPETVREKMLVNSMREFATQHKLEYFPDWGTLTLPTRGVIFDRGGFNKSDINNYMIGESGGQLIQMYSYTPNVDVQVNNKPYPIYLVGQIAVPGKNYGGIIVMKNKLLDRKPKGYQKYDLEWADFNKKYDVFATDIDKITSFELLHPSYMTFLHDQINLDFTLEVVDNIIYFYTKVDTNVKNYETLLQVLLRAHKELKM